MFVMASLHQYSRDKLAMICLYPRASLVQVASAIDRVAVMASLTAMKHLG